MSAPPTQLIPPSGPAREALREKGQFWTPGWLARVMAAWVVQEDPPAVFDPAVGPGTFFAAARAVGFRGSFVGFELDEATLAQGRQSGLAGSELAQVIVGDFISSRITSALPAVISNPPYIRHHRLSEARKNELRALALQCLGFALDGRVGLHFYFLLKCLENLAPGGRLAFLVPADVCEGISSAAAWRRLGERFRIDAVITFDETAAPFPSVDTNALVLLLSRQAPASHVRWLRVQKPDSEAILTALGDEPREEGTNGSIVTRSRDLKELLDTGMSRPPRPRGSAGTPLSHLARVVRGIATGANEELLPDAMRAYLEHGERLGLPERPLIKTRRPWYRMEQRTAPPLLFAYLGRRDCRFILNRAGIVPLTCFLCVYPWAADRDHVERLWRALNHPDTLANLVFVAKSYGGGALKVEPRQLEMLEIPSRVLRELGLEVPRSLKQLTLLDAPARPRPTLPRPASSLGGRGESSVRRRAK